MVEHTHTHTHLLFVVHSTNVLNMLADSPIVAGWSAYPCCLVWVTDPYFWSLDPAPGRLNLHISPGLPIYIWSLCTYTCIHCIFVSSKTISKASWVKSKTSLYFNYESPWFLVIADDFPPLFCDDLCWWQIHMMNRSGSAEASGHCRARGDESGLETRMAGNSLWAVGNL